MGAPGFAVAPGRWRDQLTGVRYLIGDLVAQGQGWRFKATSGGLIDEGPAFYAPQVLAEPDRTLLWGWAWELGRSAQQIADAGWAGVLTFPRELYLRDGVLGVRPATELSSAASRTLALAAGPAFPGSGLRTGRQRAGGPAAR